MLLAGCSAGRESASEVDLGANVDGGIPDQGLSGTDLGGCSANVIVTPNQGVAPVTLVATTSAITSSKPTWSVQTPNGIVTPTATDGSGFTVRLEADDPGSYIFQVEFSGGGPCPGEGIATVVAPNASVASYRFRLTPPAHSGLPQQDLIRSIYGKTPQTGSDLTLSAGFTFSAVLRAASGPIAGDVRLFPMSGPEFDVAVDATGAFSLPIDLATSYSVVLIPQDPLLAPTTVGSELGAMLMSSQMMVGPGEAVTGIARDASSAPLPGLRIALRQGSLPSGLGTTAADGSFTLRAQAGTYQLAAAADGWPDLTLDGVSVPSGGVTVNLAQALPRNAITLRLVRADGVTPVSGAQVTLRSATLPAAAQVTVGGVAHPAGGVARLRRISAADGSLGSIMLPASDYDVLIDTADVGTGVPEGTTGLHATMNTAGTITLQLAPLLTVSGHVRDSRGNPVTGARVRAIPSGGTGVVRSTTSDGVGAFSLAVAAGVPIDLVADPPAMALLASARMHLGATDGSLGGALPSTAEVVLPDGLPISGTVRGPSLGSSLGGVGIDVLCLSCADPTPIAHAQSDDNGAYVLSLPDPGLLHFDGGTD
jgi:hypothetical protein